MFVDTLYIVGWGGFDTHASTYFRITKVDDMDMKFSGYEV